MSSNDSAIYWGFVLVIVLGAAILLGARGGRGGVMIAFLIVMLAVFGYVALGHSGH